MRLDWEEVRRGDLIFISGSYRTIVRVKKHEIVGPPPGPLFFWAVDCVDSGSGKIDRKVIKTFEDEALVVERLSL